ncbi:hypothetical protein ES332_1Z000900v1 [Gossypium tomentosum]|uniref:Reverse transcriptase zinc-binding domain-containing protein n=1 Tax=Gossypium tomentosum TaxID=34277 RepID=A0A5C7J3L1_GOSTO|nr:hypothetical protein ES332_1Z005600v1 [Gossypium tomentosum]TXG75236.1 hypothetical protein ES332_1Z004300v1 [Gossypium tomentosum]TXG75279.1 hypothetical protein ES332_1Z000900v1 [Gossypium tomentosum]
MDSFCWRIGNGRTAMFWMDIWCGNLPLKQEFPRLFRLTRQKEGTIADFIRNYGFCREEWNDLFTRSLLGKEEVMLSKLVERVSSTVLVSDVEDKFCWANDRNGEFSVRKCSEILIRYHQEYEVFYGCLLLTEFLQRNFWSKEG